MSHPDILSDKQFSCRKWTFFTFSLIEIIAQLVFVITTCLIIDDESRTGSMLLESNHNSSSSYNLALEGNFTHDVPFVMKFAAQRFNNTNDDDPAHASAKRTAKAIIIAVGVISILIQLAGVVGALKEKIWVLYLYFGLNGIIVTANILEAVFYSPGSWLVWLIVFGVLFFMITLLAILLVHSLGLQMIAQFQLAAIVADQTNPNLIYGIQVQMYPAQINVPMQQFNQVDGTYSNNPGHIYSNSSNNQYQSFQAQYPAQQQDGHDQSNGPNPPPYAGPDQTTTKYNYN